MFLVPVSAAILRAASTELGGDCLVVGHGPSLTLIRLNGQAACLINIGVTSWYSIKCTLVMPCWNVLPWSRAPQQMREGSGKRSYVC